MTEVQSYFEKQFGFASSRTARAPGRLELLGNHTDYNQGLVMALAIDKQVAIAASPRSDGRIELASSLFSERESFSIDRIEKNLAASWADYIKGVLLQLRRRGVLFGGFNAAIHGTIPMGAGLSSSAALEVAAALIVRQLYPHSVTDTGATVLPQRDAQDRLPPLTTLEKLSLARLCQAAENQFVGVHCGLLDPISSLFGKAFHVMQIDCRDLTVGLTPLDGDLAVVMCNSGVRHALVGGEYNELRRQCEEAARAMQVESLRLIDARQLVANRKKLTDRQFECAYHIVGENQRVLFGERALRAGDLEQFGRYLFQSHDSSRDYFKNSCPELDLLVDLARSQPACLGARLSGGGFGGATINLVQRPRLDDFRTTMAAQYEQRTGRKLEATVCQVVDGAN